MHIFYTTAMAMLFVVFLVLFVMLAIRVIAFDYGGWWRTKKRVKLVRLEAQAKVVREMIDQGYRYWNRLDKLEQKIAKLRMQVGE